MSEVLPSSPVDQYYAGLTATFEVMSYQRESTLAVTPHIPREEDILDRAKNARWQVLDDPRTTQQFEVLVLNQEVRGPAVVEPTTAGEYNVGNLYEAAVWAAQNPAQQLVLLPNCNLTYRELVYYAKTGRMSVENGDGTARPLDSLSGVARAIRAAGIEVERIYGRSAGTKEASVLAWRMGKYLVLGAAPQITERTATEVGMSAIDENSEERLLHSGHTAKDGFQWGEKWENKVTEARKNAPKRQRPTGRFAAATLGNGVVRLAHMFALGRGTEPFLADLRGLGERLSPTVLSMVVYKEDALYGQGLDMSLRRILAHFALQEGPYAPHASIVPVKGGHRFPERYPRLTNDMTDALMGGGQ